MCLTLSICPVSVFCVSGHSICLFVFCLNICFSGSSSVTTSVCLSQHLFFCLVICTSATTYVWLSQHLFVCLHICLSVFTSVFLAVCTFACLNIFWPYVCQHVSIRLYIHLSVFYLSGCLCCLSYVYPHVCLCRFLSVLCFLSPVCLSAYLYDNLSVHKYIRLSICTSVLVYESSLPVNLEGLHVCQSVRLYLTKSVHMYNVHIFEGIVPLSSRDFSITKTGKSLVGYPFWRNYHLYIIQNSSVHNRRNHRTVSIKQKTFRTKTH